MNLGEAGREGLERGDEKMPLWVGKVYLTQEDVDRELEAVKNLDFDYPPRPWWRRVANRILLAFGR